MYYDYSVTALRNVFPSQRIYISFLSAQQLSISCYLFLKSNLLSQSLATTTFLEARPNLHHTRALFITPLCHAGLLLEGFLPLDLPAWIHITEGVEKRSGFKGRMLKHSTHC